MALACGDDVAFVRASEGAVARFDGRAWTPIAPIPGEPRGLALWTNPAGTVVFAASGEAIYRWGHGRWATHSAPLSGIFARSLISFDGVGALAPSIGRVVAWDGDSYEAYDAGTWRALFAIWGMDESDLWMAGGEGVVVHFDGRRFARRDIPRGSVMSLWGTDDDDVWALTRGERARVYHWDGDRWRSRSRGLGRMVLNQIGGAADEVYAVGPEGVVRWTGHRWRRLLRVRHPRSRNFVAVCATRTHIIIVEEFSSSSFLPARAWVRARETPTATSVDARDSGSTSGSTTPTAAAPAIQLTSDAMLSAFKVAT